MGTENPNALPPPSPMTGRKCGIAPNALNTVEVPHDPQEDNYANWFQGQLNIGTPPSTLPPIRPGNKVTPLITGQAAFAAMAAAIQKATGSQSFVYLLNWFVNLDISLGPGSLWDLLSGVVTSGGQVRGMFWRQWSLTQNSAERDRINTLSNPAVAGANGGAILDSNHLDAGAHHQKVLIVNGSDGLVGFCGGIDFNPDRINAVASSAGSPYHDVHCQIQGTAAWDLLSVFLQRWTDHPDAAAIDGPKGAPRGNSVGLPLPPDPGVQYVQIGRTFGNGSGHVGIKSKSGQSCYSWAPNGEQTARGIIFNAVSKAKKYIYVQDQYLISMAASNQLKAQLGSIDRLIILIPHPSLSDLPNVWARQKAFLDNLGYNASDAQTNTKTKILVRYLKPVGQSPQTLSNTSPNTYVHSKIWIIDDKFAVIGSANCNNRGYTHDSEVVAGIYDSSNNQACNMHFAHDLRVQLWAKHLNVVPSEVFDPGADAHWLKPELSSCIAVFDQNAGTDIPYASYISGLAGFIPGLGGLVGAGATATDVAKYYGTDPDGS